LPSSLSVNYFRPSVMGANPMQVRTLREYRAIALLTASGFLLALASGREVCFPRDNRKQQLSKSAILGLHGEPQPVVTPYGGQFLRSSGPALRISLNSGQLTDNLVTWSHGCVEGASVHHGCCPGIVGASGVLCLVKVYDGRAKHPRRAGERCKARYCMHPRTGSLVPCREA
jgi:hypothetical protein